MKIISTYFCFIILFLSSYPAKCNDFLIEKKLTTNFLSPKNSLINLSVVKDAYINLLIKNFTSLDSRDQYALLLFLNNPTYLRKADLLFHALLKDLESQISPLPTELLTITKSGIRLNNFMLISFKDLLEKLTVHNSPSPYKIKSSCKFLRIDKEENIRHLVTRPADNSYNGLTHKTNEELERIIHQYPALENIHMTINVRATTEKDLIYEQLSRRINYKKLKTNNRILIKSFSGDIYLPEGMPRKKQLRFLTHELHNLLTEFKTYLDGDNITKKFPGHRSSFSNLTKEKQISYWQQYSLLTQMKDFNTDSITEELLITYQSKLPSSLLGVEPILSLSQLKSMEDLYEMKSLQNARSSFHNSYFRKRIDYTNYINTLKIMDEFYEPFIKDHINKIKSYRRQSLSMQNKLNNLLSSQLEKVLDKIIPDFQTDIKEAKQNLNTLKRSLIPELTAYIDFNLYPGFEEIISERLNNTNSLKYLKLEILADFSNYLLNKKLSLYMVINSIIQVNPAYALFVVQDPGHGFQHYLNVFESALNMAKNYQIDGGSFAILNIDWEAIMLTSLFHDITTLRYFKDRTLHNIAGARAVVTYLNDHNRLINDIWQLKDQVFSERLKNLQKACFFLCATHNTILSPKELLSQVSRYIAELKKGFSSFSELFIKKNISLFIHTAKDIAKENSFKNNPVMHFSSHLFHLADRLDGLKIGERIFPIKEDRPTYNPVLSTSERIKPFQSGYKFHYNPALDKLNICLYGLLFKVTPDEFLEDITSRAYFQNNFNPQELTLDFLEGLHKQCATNDEYYNSLAACIDVTSHLNNEITKNLQDDGASFITVKYDHTGKSLENPAKTIIKPKQVTHIKEVLEAFKIASLKKLPNEITDIFNYPEVSA